MQKPAMRSTSFRKSSYSNSQGECVEVALYSPRLVAVRDSKDVDDYCLLITADGWQQFVSRVRGGHTSQS